MKIKQTWLNFVWCGLAAGSNPNVDLIEAWSMHAITREMQSTFRYEYRVMNRDPFHTSL